MNLCRRFTTEVAKVFGQGFRHLVRTNESYFHFASP
jgi:hypothetical protein